MGIGIHDGLFGGGAMAPHLRSLMGRVQPIHPLNEHGERDRQQRATRSIMEEGWMRRCMHASRLQQCHTGEPASSRHDIPPPANMVSFDGLESPPASIGGTHRLDPNDFSIPPHRSDVSPCNHHPRHGPERQVGSPARRSPLAACRRLEWNDRFDPARHSFGAPPPHTPCHARASSFPCGETSLPRATKGPSRAVSPRSHGTTQRDSCPADPRDGVPGAG